MILYKNVLIEREYKNIPFYHPDRVKAFLDFDTEKPVGKCMNPQVKEDGLYCDIEALWDIEGLFPAIQYQVSNKDSGGKTISGRILGIGVSKKGNSDLSIPKIGKGEGFAILRSPFDETPRQTFREYWENLNRKE